MGTANFIIAGVNKAGSTSLFHYLNSHPEICGSSDKETCYFLPLLYGGEPGPISEYEQQFDHCKNVKYRMESTPAYFYGGEQIAGTLKETLGDIKILIILKDPVERLKSFYTRKKSTLQLPSNMDFSQYVQHCLSMKDEDLDKKENQIYTGLYLGLYSKYMKAWFDTFGSKNLKVVFFDQLIKSPSVLLFELCEWLQIDPAFYNSYNFDVKNKSVSYKLKSFHKAVLTLNDLSQRFWKRNPRLKSKLLKVYYHINGQPIDKSEFKAGTMNELYSYFRPYNDTLISILKQQGVDNLPDWLRNEKVPE